VRVALFTGGIDRHYATGLCKTLATAGVHVDVICNSEMSSDEGLRSMQNLALQTIYPISRANSNKFEKVLAFIAVYLRFIVYAVTTRNEVFHILWNYKFPVFDRTLLLLFYKLLGKRVVFTAHNINAAERDGSDSLLNRLSLRFQYRNVDNIFVHTEKMKEQLIHIFGVREQHVTVIPFGTYDMVPQTSLTPSEAKQRLGLKGSEKAVLFFGRIAPYKGLDLLVDAFLRVASKDASYRLIIAGEPMKDAGSQWRDLRNLIERSTVRKQVIQQTRYIPDDEIEVFFKAADVLALPYTGIFQSGVLFMSYSFGLPVIATDVGSFGSDIVQGETGFVCRAADSEDLARTIETYFSSGLYKTLDGRRGQIKDFIRESHSWTDAGSKTVDLYTMFRRGRAVA